MDPVEVQERKRTWYLIRIWRNVSGWDSGGLSISLVILDGIPAFMNVEDNTTGEEGMDYMGQSATPLMRYQLYVPWDDLQCNE